MAITRKGDGNMAFFEERSTENSKKVFDTLPPTSVETKNELEMAKIKLLSDISVNLGALVDALNKVTRILDKKE